MRRSLLGGNATNTGAPGSPAYKVLLDQLNASCEELEVRKEEVLILRSQLVSQKEAVQHKVPWNQFIFSTCVRLEITGCFCLWSWMQVDDALLAVIRLFTFMSRFMIIIISVYIAIILPHTHTPPKEKKSIKFSFKNSLNQSCPKWGPLH